MLAIIFGIAVVASVSRVNGEQARADVRNPAASLIHARIQQKFAWLGVPAAQADSAWSEGVKDWWTRIEGAGQIYAPQWEALVYGYGQYLAYQRQHDAYLYEELNQQMHSVMYATRNFLETRAVEFVKTTEKKVKREFGRRDNEMKRNMARLSRERNTRADAVNLAAAQVHLKLAQTALRQKNYHSVEVQKALTAFYNELKLAKQNGMSPTQWHKIVGLRVRVITQRNHETNQHYTYLVQYSHYVLYKYRFTW